MSLGNYVQEWMQYSQTIPPAMTRWYRPRPLKPEELELDAYFEWFNLEHPRALAYHVPNEGKRARHIAKRIGIRAGIPDIFVDEPRGTYHGLRIEMKRTDGNSVIQDTQVDMIVAMNLRRYYAVICWGWESAREVTVNYLALEEGMTMH